jgi:hypothetical protein
LVSLWQRYVLFNLANNFDLRRIDA